jgi:hypothetical protein
MLPEKVDFGSAVGSLKIKIFIFFIYKISPVPCFLCFREERSPGNEESHPDKEGRPVEFQETFPGKEQPFAENEEMVPLEEEPFLEIQETHPHKEEPFVENKETLPLEEE